MLRRRAGGEEALADGEYLAAPKTSGDRGSAGGALARLDGEVRAKGLEARERDEGAGSMTAGGSAAGLGCTGINQRLASSQSVQRIFKSSTATPLTSSTAARTATVVSPPIWSTVANASLSFSKKRMSAVPASESKLSTTMKSVERVAVVRPKPSRKILAADGFIAPVTPGPRRTSGRFLGDFLALGESPLVGDVGSFKAKDERCCCFAQYFFSTRSLKKARNSSLVAPREMLTLIVSTVTPQRLSALSTAERSSPRKAWSCGRLNAFSSTASESIQRSRQSSHSCSVAARARRASERGSASASAF